MSPPAVQQVISALQVILGEDGTNRGMYSPYQSLYFSKFKLVSYCYLIWNWNSNRGKEAGTDKGEQQLLQVGVTEDGVWGAGGQRLPCHAHHALQPCQDPCLLPWMPQPKCTLHTISLSLSLNAKIWYASNVLKIHIGCGCDCCIPCHTIASGKGPHMHICCTYSWGPHQGIGGTFLSFSLFQMWISYLIDGVVLVYVSCSKYQTTSEQFSFF